MFIILSANTSHISITNGDGFCQVLSCASDKGERKSLNIITNIPILLRLGHPATLLTSQFDLKQLLMLCYAKARFRVDRIGKTISFLSWIFAFLMLSWREGEYHTNRSFIE